MSVKEYAVVVENDILVIYYTRGGMFTRESCMLATKYLKYCKWLDERHYREVTDKTEKEKIVAKYLVRKNRPKFNEYFEPICSTCKNADRVDQCHCDITSQSCANNNNPNMEAK